MGLLCSRLYRYYYEPYKNENLEIVRCFCLSCNLYDPYKREHFMLLKHLQDKYNAI